MIKHLAEEFKKQFACLGVNTEKYITLTVPIEKEVTRIDKKGEEIINLYYNLLKAHNLWQAHYQILSTIFLKELIQLNVKLDTMIKNVKHMEINISVAAVFLNT